jgi:hypothetical protein
MQILPPPGPQRTRQLALLAVMVVVLAVYGYTRIGAGPTASAPAASNPGTATTGGPVSKALPESVKLEDLDSVPVEPEGRRNLFRFGMKPAPPPPPAPPVTAAPPPVVAPPPQPVGPPPIPWKAVGRHVISVPVGVVPDPVTGAPVQQVKNVTIVTLRDPSTGQVVQAEEGKIIDGRYKLLKIGLQSVEMSYLDGSGYVRIPFGGV